VGITRRPVRNLTSRRRAGRLDADPAARQEPVLTQERTASRKIQEAILALWLERNYSKDEILELYLNRVYFGAGAYGVEAAAQRYYGKSAREVTLAEAAVLAGLVQAPSRLAPNRNPEGARARAELVIAAMADLGFATPAQAKTALAAPAQPSRPRGAGSLNYAADFVMDVLDDFVGTVETDIVVATTIDLGLQAAAERAIVDELNAKGARYNVGQGALVAMQPDGALKALVGGRNYGDSQFNRAPRRAAAGLGLQALRLSRGRGARAHPRHGAGGFPRQLPGLDPGELLAGLPRARDLARGAGAFAQHGGREGGVRGRGQGGGADRPAARHRSPLQANPSIALGTSEVTPLELVAAYAAFANGGTGVIPYAIKEVKTTAGKSVYRRPAGGGLGRVIDPNAVAMMNTMMRDTFVIGTAKKGEIPGWEAAARRARARISATPGSWATRAPSSPACGWATTTAIRRSGFRGATCPSRCGAPS
jgi:penicillin-binding protein 1A